MEPEHTLDNSKLMDSVKRSMQQIYEINPNLARTIAEALARISEELSEDPQRPRRWRSDSA